MGRTWALGVLAACATGTPADSADTAPPADAECGTWASVGEPFVLTWCAGCHSAALPVERRYGAPEGLDLDTLDAVRAQRAAFLGAALGDSPRMPPAGGVPLAERETMAAWLACGAPGEAHRLAPVEGGVGLVRAGELLGGFGEPEPGEFYSVFSDGPDAALQFFFTGSLDGELDLVGWTVADGEVLLGIGAYEPGLPLWPPERVGAHPISQAVSWGDEADDGERTWTLTVEDESDPDPRFGDLDTARWTLSDGAGARFELWMSTRAGLVAADYAWGPLAGYRKDRLLMLSAAAPSDRSEGFPVWVGDAYIARWTVVTEAP